MKSITYIKAQLAKLRDQQVEILSSKKGGGGGYGIKRAGQAQVAFIGFPSVGKSSLLNQLTGGRTDSKVASYDFTTLTAIPGMMKIESTQIQLIDLPGIILGAAQGKGRGKEILGVVRTADLILIIICFRPDGILNVDDLFKIRNELYNVGIRLNDKLPRMNIQMRTKGGVGVTSQVKQSVLTDDIIKQIMYEYKMQNSGVYLYEDLSPERFIDGVLKNRMYIKELVIVNKVDLATPSELKDLPKIMKKHKADYITISATEGTNIQSLKRQIFDKLELIRIYMKEPNKEPDFDEPMVMHIGATIGDVCLKIHKDFVRLFRYGQVWGPSAKHPGQRFIKPNHVLEDKDVLLIILKK